VQIRELAEHEDAHAEQLAISLMQFNQQVRGYDFTALRLGAFQGNQLNGGLLGATGWDWLHIDVLFVAPEQRNRGLGRTLVNAALQAAKRRGCLGAYLDTFDFQAKDFYRKLGFEVFAELADFPRGHTRYWMRLRF
jgi:GNAT superfamily N-acetyltransferase